MPSSRRSFVGTIGAAVAASLAGCSGISESPYTPGSDEDSEWPMAGYEQTNSSWNPDASAPRNDVSVRWKTEIDPKPYGRPIVAGGLVFVTLGRELLAIDSASGDIQWRIGGETSLLTTPAVHDGTVYVGKADTSQPGVLALHATDGSERWTFESRDDVHTAPQLAYDLDGNLQAMYVGDETGRVSKLDPSTGAVQRAVEVFGSVSCLGIDVGLDTNILVGTGGGELYSFADTGDRIRGLWRRRVGGKVTAIGTTSVGPVVASFGGPLYRLSNGAYAGQPKWTHEPGAMNLAVTRYDVIGTDGGGLVVLDASSGEQRWQLDGGYHAGPAVVGDLLIAGGGDLGENGSGFVSAYDLRGDLTSSVLGRTRWTFDTEDAVVEGISVADGAVFFGTQGVDAPAWLYALESA
ncbi:MAG: PQQ-binding-like beta-propeller repeat protein [Halorientalis sp.]